MKTVSTIKTASYLLIFGIILSATAVADSTFFDNENDFFIMGGGSAASTVDAAPATTKAEDGGRSCPRGYNRTQGKCVNITTINNINMSEEENYSKINITPSEPEEANQIEERPVAVNEPVPSAQEEKKENRRLVPLLIAGGLILVLLMTLCGERNCGPPL